MALQAKSTKAFRKRLAWRDSSPAQPQSRERPSREAAERPINEAPAIGWRTPVVAGSSVTGRSAASRLGRSRLCNGVQGVAGSNPISSTNPAPVSIR